MTEILRPDLCVLGGGAAGLAAARAASGLGAEVVLIEKRAIGAHAAEPIALQAFCAAARAVAKDGAARFGVGGEPRIDFGRLRAQIKDTIAHFALDNAAARLAALDIRIIRGLGSFTSPTRLEAGGFSIEARYYIVATGATPALPAIAGLELLRPLAADELLLGADLPKSLIMIGANSDELALAQALARLGTRVAIVAPGKILPDEDEELLAPVLTRMRRDGVVIHEQAEILRLEPQRVGLRIILGPDAAAIDASHLFVSAQPIPAVEGFGLKNAHVGYGPEGIKTDAEGKTSNARIRAIGAVAGGSPSARLAHHQGERVAAVLFGPPQAIAAPVARVTCTDPEIASIGLSEAAAKVQHKSIRMLRAAFSESERARAAFGAAGHVKIVTDSHGHILGAGIVGPQARELIGIFSLAIAKHLKAPDLDAVLSNAPTLTEVCRTAALASAPQLGKAWLGARFNR